MKAKHLVLAAAGAAVVGAIIGHLTAPRRGKETRENILDFIRSHYPGMKEKRIEALADQIAKDINEK